MQQAPPPSRFVPRPFRPAPWAPGPHLQTLAGKLLRPAALPQLARERWETSDGDFLDLDFASGPGAPPASAPLALVLHGLEGNARRGYALLAYRELMRAGIGAVGLNFRSCSGEPNRLPRAYHSGETGDLAFVLERLAERFPGRPLVAMGFSLGGNVLLKYLGETGAKAPLVAAAVISVPYDLAAGARALEDSPMGRLYGWWFLRSLRRKTREKTALLTEHIALASATRARTIREFDDLATAPLHGFRDAAAYYAECSSAGWLARVRKPTLLVHAEDDPFLPTAHIPLQRIRENPHLVLALAASGGHVGFIEGTPTEPRFWAEEQAARFLAEALAARPEVCEKKS